MHTLSRFSAATACLLSFTCLAQAQTSNWTQTGSGTYNWSDAANWSNGVPNANNATAVFSNAGADASKTVTVAGTITVQQLLINATQANPLTISGGTIRVRNVGGGCGSLSPIVVGSYTTPVTHTISSTIDLDGSSGIRVFSAGTNATLNLAGQLINSASNATYVVAGGGTTVLSGNNAGFNSTLQTTGAGTTLTVNGTVGSPVTVGNGTTLNGTGTINGPVTVNDGTVGGNLTVSSLSLSGATNYTSLVGGTPASPVNQKVTINGALIAQPGTTLNFNLVDDGTLVPGGTYTITLLDAASISGLTAGQVNATATNFGFSGTPLATIDSTNGNVNLTFTVVPEPATELGIGAASLGALGLVRRRRAARA